MNIIPPAEQYISQAGVLSHKASTILLTLDSAGEDQRSEVLKDVLATLSLCQASISAAKSILLSELDRVVDDSMGENWP